MMERAKLIRNGRTVGNSVAAAGILASSQTPPTREGNYSNSLPFFLLGHSSLTVFDWQV